MLQLLSRLCKLNAAGARSAGRRSPYRARLEVENLEGRLVMSGGPILSVPQLPPRYPALLGTPQVNVVQDRPVIDLAAIRDVQNRQFVIHLYSDLGLTRPDAPTLTTLASQLDSGPTTRVDVARGAIFSANYAQVVVQNLFQSMLHRAYNPQTDSAIASSYLSAVPMAGTMMPWMGNPHSTLATMEDLATSIATTPEYFQTRGGGTLNGWVTAVYADALQRAPTASELAAAHGPGPDRAVATAVFHSQAHQVVQMTSYYQVFLHRPLDPAGQAYWQGRYQSGVRSEEILAEIVMSDEYYHLN